MTQSIRIAEHTVGVGQPCFVIAEAGVNHNGRMDLARRLIDAAAEAGADAVKFQAFVTEKLVTRSAPKTPYQQETTGRKKQEQYEMLKALELAADQMAALREHCAAQGILFLCTPYDAESVDRLDELDVAAYKVASTDLTNVPLLRYIAAKERPVILSTGMSRLGEVEDAVDALRERGAGERLVLLHCVSEYPTPVEQINLRAITTLQRAFGVPVGFSDHTRGTRACTWAVARGACVIEKHFTLDRALPGPDHRASLEPSQLKDMVRDIRDLERALGDGIKRIMPCERANKPLLQKSLVAARPIAAGEVISEEDLAAKRPGHGLSPRHIDHVVGRRAACDIAADALVTEASVDWISSEDG